MEVCNSRQHAWAWRYLLAPVFYSFASFARQFLPHRLFTASLGLIFGICLINPIPGLCLLPPAFAAPLLVISAGANHNPLQTPLSRNQDTTKTQPPDDEPWPRHLPEREHQSMNESSTPSKSNPVVIIIVALLLGGAFLFYHTNNRSSSWTEVYRLFHSR